VEGDDHGEAYTAIAWGCGDEPRNGNNAEAEAVEDAEGNMGGAAMRGSVALPGSKATSRSKGTGRNLGDLLPGRVASSRTGPYREGEEP